MRAFNESGFDGEEPLDESTSVLVAKSVTMACLCLVSVCMGVIPMQVAKCFNFGSSDGIGNPRSLKYVSVLLGFGGGVLFCTIFLHVLPEVEEGVAQLTERGVLPTELKIPLAKVLCCAGFFIMYFIEELVHTHLKCQSSKKPCIEPTLKTSSKVSIYSTDSAENYGSVADPNCNHHHHRHHHHNHHQHENGCEIGHTHLNVIDSCDDYHDGALRGLLIVLGLSVHELFEGLAIGLEGSVAHVWYMFGAVAAHKFIIAFCIGVELMTSRTRTLLCYIYVFMFAVVSPIGIGIGMLLVGGVGTDDVQGSMTAVILQGLASGTLLYVVFFEILDKNRSGMIQYCSIILGFALMLVIQTQTAHSHGGHDHGTNHTHHTHPETLTS
ncbi:zinc transporter ZIP3 isoform X2 [Copidosoma floridanum]|uniref:zinc transporter ZIP3 isoform X2 n=1 Tax=Copidosoma floridanum TaxID=29053 RepID=UPI0006C9B125|nr:zinc transporter ZIP3 isoform X2 [Copidosoma floridanum]